MVATVDFVVVRPGDAFASILLIQACEKCSGITPELGYPSPRLDGLLGV
jgi:hypothetical protein